MNEKKPAEGPALRSHPTLSLWRLAGLFSAGEYLHLHLWQEYIQAPWARSRRQRCSDQKINKTHQHSLTRVSILASASLPHPQLGARMSRWMADRGFSRQHVTVMTATGGGRTEGRARPGHTRAAPVRGAAEDEGGTRTDSQNHTSPHRSGVAQLPQVLCRAGAVQPFTSPFILGKAAQGSRKPAQNCAAVIRKRGSVHKCSTGIMVLVNAAFMFPRSC